MNWELFQALKILGEGSKIYKGKGANTEPVLMS